MSIEQELVLDVSPAEQQIETFGQDIQEIGDQAGIDLGTSIADGIQTAIASLDLQFNTDQITASITGAITDAVASFDAQAISIPVDADTSAAIESISAIETSPLTLTPDVNTEGMVADITEAIEGIDPPKIDVALGNVPQIQDEVDAAVGGASAEVDVEANVDPAGIQKSSDQISKSLGEAAASGGQSLTGLAVAATSLDSATELAEGKVSGLGDAVAHISPGATAAVAGVGALAAVSGVLFHEGLNVVTAEDRLTAAFGKNADAVQKINIDGLTGDIKELAVETGSSDSDLQQAIGTIGLFGNQSGASAKQVKQTTQEIAALALNSAAVRPELGSAADQALALQRALATGGRAAQNYGINLDSAAVQAKALQIAQADGRGEVTRFDLATAGAQLAVEGFAKSGKSLGDSFKEGVGTADRQFAAIQARIEATFSTAAVPVVKPLLDALKEVEPAAEQLGTAIAGLGAQIVPVVSDLVRSAAPAVILFTDLLTALVTPVHLVVEALDAVDPQLIEIAGAAFIFSKALDSAFAESALRSGVALLGSIRSFGEGIAESAAVSIQAAKDRAAGIDTANDSIIASDSAVIETEAELAAEVERVNATLAASAGGATGLASTDEAVASLDVSIAHLDVSVASIAESLAGLNAALGDTVATGDAASTGLDTVATSADAAESSTAPLATNLALVQKSLAPIGPDAEAAAAGLATFEEIAASTGTTVATAGGALGVLDAGLAAAGEEGATIAAAGIGVLDVALDETIVGADAAGASLGFFGTVLAGITGVAEGVTATITEMDLSLGPIGLGVLAVGALAVAFGVLGDSAGHAGSEVSDAAKQIFEVKDSGQKAADQVETLRDKIVDYLKTQDEFKDNGFTTAADKVGLSVKVLADTFAAGQGKIQAVRDTLTHSIDDYQRAEDAIIAAAGGATKYSRALGDTVAALTPVRDALNKYITDLEAAAKQQVSLALGTGAVTAKELTALENRNRLKDGTVDYITVEKLLQTKLQDVSDAQAIAAQVDARAATQKRVLTSALGGNRQGWDDLTASISNGSITLDDAATVSDKYGLSVADTTTFIQGIQSAVDQFVQSADAGLPTVADALGLVTTAAQGLGDVSNALSAFQTAQQNALQATTTAAQQSADAQKQSLQDTDAAYKDSADKRKANLQSTDDAFQANIAAVRSQAGDNKALLAQLDDESKQHSDATKTAIAAIDADTSAHSKNTSTTLDQLDRDTKSKIQSIEDTAKNAKFDLTGFLHSQQVTQLQTQSFFDGINHIAAAGFPELATDLEKIGPTAGGALVSSLAAATPDIQAAYAKAFTPHIDPATFLTNLSATQKEITDFGTNIATIIAQFPKTAAFLLKQGAAQGGDLAQSIADGITSPKGQLIATGIEQNLSATGTTAGDAFDAQVRNVFVPKLAETGVFLDQAYTTTLDPTGAIKTVKDKGVAAFGQITPELATAAAISATGVTKAMQGQFEAVTPAAAKALVDAGVAVQKQGGPELRAALGATAGDSIIEFTKNFDPATPAGKAILKIQAAVDKNTAAAKKGSKDSGKSIGDSIADGIRESDGDIDAAIVAATNNIGSAFSGLKAGLPVGGSIAAGVIFGISAGEHDIGQAILNTANTPVTNLDAVAAGLALGASVAVGVGDGLIANGSTQIAAVLPSVISTPASNLEAVAGGIPLGGSVAAGIEVGIGLSSASIGKSVGENTNTPVNQFDALAAGLPLGAAVIAGMELAFAIGSSDIGKSLSTAVTGAIPKADQVLVQTGLDLMQGLADGTALGYQVSVVPVLKSITKDIPNQKGPPGADYALLQDAGHLIMAGFQQSLEAGAKPVEDFLSGLGPHLADQISAKPFVAPLTVQVRSTGGAAPVTAVTAASPVTAVTPGGARSTLASGPPITKRDLDEAVQTAVRNGGVTLAAGASIVGKIDTTDKQDPEAVAAKVAFRIGSR